MPLRFVEPDRVHRPVMPAVHAVVADRTVYVSAQLPLDQDGLLVGPDDIDRQAEQVFTNLSEVLRAAGAQLGDVVKMTTYILDLEHRPQVMDVRNRFFGSHRAPSIIAVVDGLPVEGALLEVDAIAVLD